MTPEPNKPSTTRRGSGVADRVLAQENERLTQENDGLREHLAEQAQKIAELERQLALRHQYSTASSKPPSSDGLAGRP